MAQSLMQRFNRLGQRFEPRSRKRSRLGKRSRWLTIFLMTTIVTSQLPASSQVPQLQSLLQSSTQFSTQQLDQRSGQRLEQPSDQRLPVPTAVNPVRLTQTTQNSAIVINAVDSVGMTVADMDRSVEFYVKVLSFKKISDVEVWGPEYEQLQGIFGVRLRVVKLQLGQEFLELTEYLTPKGRPIPIDSRSHDRWFQHIAIVVSDMDQAYQRLRQFKVQYASTAPQRIPDTNKVAAGIRAFYFKDPDGHNLEIIYFPPGKGDPKWQKPTQQLFLGIRRVGK
ncbi:VOC family protein [Alkalinema pantanalense CENA528]|uniref:VOC family protein n=1 Tax=Alkalinema pantanalense TaxID=1620705 RepID=UPI003D6DDA6E